jgi:N-methylhydantoinase B
VTQYELLEDRGGPGRWRGGLGTTREIEFLDDAGYSLEGDGSETPPPGLFGGAEGTPGAVLLNRGTDGEIELPSKFPYRKAAAGHRLCLVSPCGGGYGNPLERSREAVQEDLIDGYVSRESARTHYGLEGNE